MQIEDLLRKAKESVDIHQVFGEPYDREGVTIIPVARITGGGGGGTGTAPRNAETGTGMGYGFRAEPAGVYVISGGKVTWQPAVNANKVIAGSFVIAIIGILGTPRIIKQARKFFR
jgi:uncharacterized spore protein YtfJ